MSKYRYEFRVMVEEDREDVAQLVAQCFAGKETITKYLGESVEECYANYAKPVALSAVPNLSFVCIDHFAKNEIIACILCKNVEVEDMQSIEPLNAKEAFDRLNNDFKRRFLALHKNDNVKDHLSNECICLKDKYGSRGIATNLIRLSLINAKHLGYQFALMMPTVHEMVHTVKEKLNARKLFGVHYADIEYNGISYFKTITDPKSYDAYEITLADFDTDCHRVKLSFD
ncbi:hypothetical protein B4U80_11864 [Leptotrombidium deliense]|uniref:N-acetyltransferase domain-containing protein n=1 Tax=Leptotrombidium deliense TaxID=299467 RepID=A0A443S1L8_9ACAR|nr:hypothetical protein B4U80_11864 [Leptotrombidium deliense]